MAIGLAMAMSGAAAAQGKERDVLPGQGIEWQGDWEAALEEAAARNAPILVAVGKDGCQYSKAMTDSVYTDPKVVQLAQSFVCVPAHMGSSHGEKEVRVGREPATVCREYRTVGCDTHRRAEALVNRFFTGTFMTPTVILLDPSGREIAREVGAMPAADFARRIGKALAKVPGEKLATSAWKPLRKALEDADAALQTGEYRKAIEALQKLARRGRGCESLRQKRIRLIEEAGAKLLEEALSEIDVEERKRALRKIAEEFKGLEVGEKAKTQLRALGAR